MGLFKNKVGRPSNKTIRTRRIIYSLLAITVIGLLFAASYMLNSAFNLHKIKGASKRVRINTPIIEIASVDSKLKIGEESFETGNYIKTDNIGEDLVSINKNKKIKVRGRFPKLFYSGFWKNKFIFRAMAYGQNDTLIGQVQSSKITKETFEYEFTITSDVKYIKADVVIGIEGYFDYPFIESVTNFITTADASKVGIKYNSDSGFTIDSTGTLIANAESTYSIHAIIENGNNETLYYRWFTFDGVNPSSSKVTNNGEANNKCNTITKSTLVRGLKISSTSSAKNRSGTLKVYTSNDSCLKDNNAKTESLAAKDIKIKFNKKDSVFNSIYTSGTDGSIVIEKNTYDKGNLVHTSMTDNKTIFIKGNAKLEAKFTKEFYQTKNYYIKYIAYSSNNAVKSQSSDILIDKEKPTAYNIKITPEISYVEAKVSFGKLRSDNGNVVYSKKMTFAIKPTVTFADASKLNGKKLNLSKNSDGNFIVNKYENYSTSPTIENPSGATIYYRWFTFGQINGKGPVGYGANLAGNACVAHKETKFVIGSPGLKVHSGAPERSGKIVVYASYEACKNDKTSTSPNVGYGTVNYIYKASSSNSNNVVIELKDKNNKPGKDGIYQAKENTDYFPVATVTNNTNNTLYYRWFTYKKLNAKEYRYDDETCYTLNKGKVNVTGLERIEVSDYDRSGKLRVYSNYSNCNNDNKGAGNNYLSQAIINYKYNKKNTSSGSARVDYTDENLYVLSHIISAEASGESDECQLAVGSVVLNRVKSKHFPDTIYDVVFEPGQYSPTWEGTYYNTPTQRAINNAKYLLENGSQLPNNVLFQAGFAQGSGVYKIIDGEYFCYY